MHRQIVLALSGAQLGFAHVQRSQITDGPRNLVRRDSANIEIHQIYGAPIGVDTHYLARVGTSIKWIGHNNDYLTEVPETTTINGVKTTMEVKQQLLVVTATAAAEGVAAGDVSLLITESMQRELQTLVKAAAASCGAPARKSKRDGMSCMINAFQTAAHNDHALAAMNPAEWGDFLLEPARNAPQILTAAFQVLKTQAERNKFAVMVAAASVSGAWVAGQVAEPAGEVAYKYVFDNGLFGSSQDHPGPDQKTVTTKPTAISTASACNPTGTIDENSPACDDKDCKGDDKNVCAAEGKFKGCPCAHLTEEMIGDPFYKDFYNEWGNVQQKILKELKDGLPEIIPPQCFKNSLGNAFDGKPLAEPSGYCVCSSAKSGGSGMTTGLYSTMSGTGSSVCAYSTMPTKPISLSKKPIKTGVPVTSCRVESR
ncbi:hypothetical protein QQS21_004579 [Conoideocrella luteorostrata]|uniref:Uncharacterized protein n=1 Tax=Conoideocrella luteorostrata TaxID=1105319 RepID=A0AAJ0G1I1_9HYPO|nr:hypothetical protein QQS21_004579 [Conoideocrella luteorostrata]